MKKICLMLACVSLLLGVIPGHAGEGLQKLRLAYASVTAAFAVPWITKEAGIFRRHGLDVEIVYIASGPRTIQTLIAGGVDVAAIGGGSGIDAKMAGADTVFVATAVNRVLLYMVAAPEIRRVEDLRGKSVGATRIGTLTDFFTRYYLRQAGLVPDRDVIVRGTGGLPETVAALKAGQIHAGTFGFPAVLQARAAGFHVLVDYATQGLRYPLSGTVVTQSMIRAREPAVRSFLEAFIEGIYRFRTDPAFAIDVMGRYTRTTDRKILEESQRVYASAFERVPYPDPEDIKLVLIQVGDNNPRARSADPRDFVEGRLIREIEASGFIKRLYGEQGR
ncbi:MAG: ABC transporter substrate-binding protein [Deltaproteobacteria bacterium]|nr:ABC transporter substrate-binding protein [Deltaproteobacteria bacterium]